MAERRMRWDMVRAVIELLRGMAVIGGLGSIWVVLRSSLGRGGGIVAHSLVGGESCSFLVLGNWRDLSTVFEP